jgi:hypothetical protein
MGRLALGVDAHAVDLRVAMNREHGHAIVADQAQLARAAIAQVAAPKAEQV